MAYEKKHLLSYFEVRKLLRKALLEPIIFSLPVVTEADWDRLGRWARLAATLYTALAKFPPFRWPLLVVSPVIQAVAHRKSAASPAPE
jgi:hypothetical protein